MDIYQCSMLIVFPARVVYARHFLKLAEQDDLYLIYERILFILLTMYNLKRSFGKTFKLIESFIVSIFIYSMVTVNDGVEPSSWNHQLIIYCTKTMIINYLFILAVQLVHSKLRYFPSMFLIYIFIKELSNWNVLGKFLENTFEKLYFELDFIYLWPVITVVCGMITMYGYRNDWSMNSRRKIFHLALSLVVLTGNNGYATRLLSTISLFEIFILVEIYRYGTNYTNDLNQFLRSFTNRSKDGENILISHFSLLFALAFPRRFLRRSAIIPTLTIGISDSLASIIGGRFGGWKSRTNRTIVGSLTFLLSELTIYYLFDRNFQLIQSFSLALFMAIIEHVLPRRFNDNIIISALSTAIFYMKENYSF
ncbi:hypothetical protein SNEBB_006191 [Seison nebaliae]|nr:hypothetical protein SNEBB_006191 [Seison nebaliae]